PVSVVTATTWVPSAQRASSGPLLTTPRRVGPLPRSDAHGSTPSHGGESDCQPQIRGSSGGPLVVGETKRHADRGQAAVPTAAPATGRRPGRIAGDRDPWRGRRGAAVGSAVRGAGHQDRGHQR